MKKLGLCLILSVFLIAGCGNKDKKYEEKLKEYAFDYFNKYMVGVEGQDEAYITLAMLKTANNYDSSYNLDMFKNCSDATSVTLTIKNNNEITNYTYDLQCK